MLWKGRNSPANSVGLCNASVDELLARTSSASEESTLGMSVVTAWTGLGQGDAVSRCLTGAVGDGALPCGRCVVVQVLCIHGPAQGGVQTVHY